MGAEGEGTERERERERDRERERESTSLPIHPSTDTQVVTTSWLLYIILQWTHGGAANSSNEFLFSLDQQVWNCWAVWRFRL